MSMSVPELARHLAYRAAMINSEPMLTGKEDYWQSIPRNDQRKWEFVAAEVVEMIRKEEGL